MTTVLFKKLKKVSIYLSAIIICLNVALNAGLLFIDYNMLANYLNGQKQSLYLDLLFIALLLFLVLSIVGFVVLIKVAVPQYIAFTKTVLFNKYLMMLPISAMLASLGSVVFLRNYFAFTMTVLSLIFITNMFIVSYRNQEIINK